MDYVTLGGPERMLKRLFRDILKTQRHAEFKGEAISWFKFLDPSAMRHCKFPKYAQIVTNTSSNKMYKDTLRVGVQVW